MSAEINVRNIYGHEVNRTNEQLKIQCVDKQGAGGANHSYIISGFDSKTNVSSTTESTELNIVFQNGPIPEMGVNGVTHEALLAILEDRIQSFQEGAFANDYNAEALLLIRAAKEVLLNRTRDRLTRGVEGTHQK